MSNDIKNYVQEFETSLDEWYASIKSDLKKLDGGKKINLSAEKRIRVASRQFSKIYVAFRDAERPE